MYAFNRSVAVGLVSGAAAVVGLSLLGAAPSNAVNAEASHEGGGEVTRIVIDVDGVEIAVFSEIANLRTDALVDAENPRPVIVLERSFTEADEIFAWHRAIAEGDFSARLDFSLVLFDEIGNVVGRYAVEKGWPSRMKLSTKGFTLDTVTFTGDSVYRVDP
jgi:hypothetical protein